MDILVWRAYVDLCEKSNTAGSVYVSEEFSTCLPFARRGTFPVRMRKHQVGKRCSHSIRDNGRCNRFGDADRCRDKRQEYRRSDMDRKRRGRPVKYDHNQRDLYCAGCLEHGTYSDGDCNFGGRRDQDWDGNHHRAGNARDYDRRAGGGYGGSALLGDHGGQWRHRPLYMDHYQV